MANIKEKIDNIRQAIFGKDVRESLASGLEEINKETEKTSKKQEDLETTFNDLIINAGNSNAEVVAARNGYATVGERLKSFDEQLDKRAKKGKYVYIVSKENGDFNSIQSAVDYLDNVDYPVTIKIMPGEYYESVHVGGNKFISLIGENKKDCIIRMDSGNYNDAPLEIQGQTLVKNLTLIHTHIDNNNPIDGLRGYALHADYSGEGIAEFENCKFISYQNAAAGCGLRQNQTLRFKNCEFYSYTPKESSMLKNGAFFCHNAVESGVKGQRLEMFECFILSQNGFCMYINDANISVGNGEGNEMIARFINNTCYSETLYTQDVINKENITDNRRISGNIYLSNDSHGNNTTILNKNFNWWYYPELLSGVQNFGSGITPLKYCKNESGNVTIHGVLKNCSAQLVIANLPEGFRPNNNLIFPIVSNNSNGETKLGTVWIYRNGDIKLVDNVGDGFISININYQADE